MILALFFLVDTNADMYTSDVIREDGRSIIGASKKHLDFALKKAGHKVTNSAKRTNQHLVRVSKNLLRNSSVMEVSPSLPSPEKQLNSLNAKDS